MRSRGPPRRYELAVADELLVRDRLRKALADTAFTVCLHGLVRVLGRPPEACVADDLSDRGGVEIGGQMNCHDLPPQWNDRAGGLGIESRSNFGDRRAAMAARVCSTVENGGRDDHEE
ncbi:hypothetical protein [Nocardia otitidiscaviarum]|uniref:hypothetical protein n=1 Tax=Nocardia otitidiscaviarum TaxID=1823 RepID=UPI0018945AD6|nr:hypothetical protein [Nocardia otitidiscaviarum]MBF6178757.1 hypothetical protein [Nocardia otitidiscaviarum]